MAGRAGNGWYRGDAHVHSTYSDGELTPAQLVSQARAAGLDFIATTEHNAAAAPDAWSEVAGEDLLVILGEEATTETGHWLALGLPPGEVVDWRYRARDGVIDEHVAAVRRVGGVAVAAHPYAPFPTGAFLYPFEGFDAIEVWNGLWTSDRPWQSNNEAAVAEWGRSLAISIHNGRWRPAMGGSDTHLSDQIGTPQIVVWAEELGAEAILAGLRAGRCWIAESATIDLVVTARAGDRTAGVGEGLLTEGEPVVIEIEVHGVAAGTVSLHTDWGTVHRAPVSGSTGSVRWSTSAAESAFVRVEVRHPDGSMAALTNPIVLA